MGRPKKVAGPAFTVTATPPGTDGDAGEGPDAQTSDILGTIEDEGRRRAEGRIFRLDPATRKMALLDTVDASLADEGYVRENYGGGEYSIQMWGPRRDGSWGYLKQESKSYRIDSSVPFKGAPRDRAINAPPPNGAVPAPGSSIVDMAMIQLLNGFQEQSKSTALMQRDHSTAMMAMMERLATPREGFSMEKAVAMIGALGTVLSPLIQGMVNKKDPVEIATTLMAAMRPPDTAKSGLSALHEFLEIKDMIGGANGEQDSEGRWIGVLEKTIPGALELLKTAAQKEGKPVMEIARRPAQVAVIPSTPILSIGEVQPPAQPTPETPVTTDEWTAFEPHAQRLAHMAADAKDPYAVMLTVKTFAPSNVLAMVRELVAREDAVVMLTTRFPVLAPYAAWTAQLVEEFRNEFFGADEGDEEPPIPEGQGDTHLEE